jgi:hypothetical protein
MRLPTKITDWLSAKAAALAHSRPHDFTIGADIDPQMLRWWVIPRNKVFNLYLHNFIRSDNDEALHDHPWLFNISIIVTGTYTEQTIRAGGVISKKIFPTGTIKLRFGPAPHRVELHDGPAWTFFITGPVVREWGFHCPKGWRSFKQFAIRREGGNVRGLGCGD